jgi:hypothetical protein
MRISGCELSDLPPFTHLQDEQFEHNDDSRRSQNLANERNRVLSHFKNTLAA